jgi:hypothetical protein
MEESKTSPQGLDIVAQEAMALTLELQRLGQSRLMKITEMIVAGEYVLALCMMRVAQRQLDGCLESLDLLNRIRHLNRAAMCPHATQELLERA